MTSPANETKMTCNATDDLSPSDAERGDFVFQQLLEMYPKLSRERYDHLIGKASVACLEHLYKKGEPPCVARAYVHYLACLNIFYKVTKNSGAAGKDVQGDDQAEGQAAAQVRVVPEGVEPTDPELLMPIWKMVMKDQEIEEGLRPFEIIIPASRDFSKLFASSEELESLLGEVSALFGPDIVLFCAVGDILHPTTTFLGLRPGVDASDLGVQWRFAWAWNHICVFGTRVCWRDVNILDVVKDILSRDLQFAPRSRQQYEALKEGSAKLEELEEERRRQVCEASQKSERMARLCTAQHREMDRLADEVSAKILEGDHSLDEKARKLVEFVRAGDPSVPPLRPAARARVAERRALTLAADVVRDVVQPESGRTANQQAELIKKFVLVGDENFAILIGSAFIRLRIAEEVWPPIAAVKSWEAFQCCLADLRSIREDVEAIRELEEMYE
ncbi:hypothetical protein F5Y13DRAFT_193193 [Hypoxylon sp. FL1857]|nr:hypothetical protein F5Y13DRAFT_193193 [Hypoxylon sp. FL1857]